MRYYNVIYIASKEGNGRTYIHDSVETIGSIDSFRRFVARCGTNIGAAVYKCKVLVY